MELAEIVRLAEHTLRGAFGEHRVGGVPVQLKRDEEGEPFLDVTVRSVDARLPSARESIDVARDLRHRLIARGETRFPNVVFVSAARAA